MARLLEGQLAAGGMRLGIVVSRFNELVTRSLLSGAQETFARHGGDPEAVTVVWAPGAFELPLLAKRLAESEQCDAVIALGALIRGATPHFDYLAAAVTPALQNIALSSGVPIINAVLTCDTLEQALERAGSKAGNKGSEAAVTAIEMVSVLRQLDA